MIQTIKRFLVVVFIPTSEFNIVYIKVSKYIFISDKQCIVEFDDSSSVFK